MLRYAVAGVALISLILLLPGNAMSSQEPESAHPKPTTSTTLPETPTERPECIIDLDCGVSAYTGFGCRDDFVTHIYVSYKCRDGGWDNATCVNHTVAEVVDWCQPSEECAEGKGYCTPKITPTKKSPATDGETRISCHEDSNCGIPGWKKRYCGEDGSVYQDYIVYECRNPGTTESYCTLKKELKRIADYCGPLNPCRDGACYDDEDREPYAYKQGGYWGERWWNITKEYTCYEDGTCRSDGKVYTTCKGSWCYETKTLYSEVDYEPGHLPSQ
ncbi:MAG: hypothetical protein GF416_00200 [Candidatus Altiarchaeales archaeon]|nr:hypothetical protein [Candidatus Altiarchaeales archaeon]MBD3415542.1 hypothetical protein [Candidatus Altiarchaeales archaeon]